MPVGRLNRSTVAVAMAQSGWLQVCKLTGLGILPSEVYAVGRSAILSRPCLLEVVTLNPAALPTHHTFTHTGGLEEGEASGTRLQLVRAVHSVLLHAQRPGGLAEEAEGNAQGGGPKEGGAVRAAFKIKQAELEQETAVRGGGTE